MANLSNYLEEALLNHAIRNTALTAPTDVYIALFDDLANGTELEEGTLTNEITGYTAAERPVVTFTAPTQTDGKATVENNEELDFDDMPEVTVQYFAVMDNNTHSEGNILYWGEIVGDPQTIAAGNTATIPAGDITIQMD